MCGSTARTVRTADMNVSWNVFSHSSSLIARKPSVRTRAAPTLLTSTSMRPSSAAAPINCAAPSGPERSTATWRTLPSSTSARRPSLLPREPAITRAPSSASARATASPIPLLAPVTTTRLPSSPSRMPDRPIQRVVGDLFPAVLADREVRAALEGLELGHRVGVLVLLRLRRVDRLGDHVVLAAGDEQQRRAIVVAVVHLGRGARVEVRERALEEHAAGPGDGVALPDGLRLLGGHRVRERVVELLGREQHRAVAVERALEDRERRLQLGRRQREDALGGGGIDRHAGGAVAAVE